MGNRGGMSMEKKKYEQIIIIIIIVCKEPY